MQSSWARLEHFFTFGAKSSAGARPFGLNVAEAEVGRARFGDDDEVDARGHELGRETKGLATEPFDSVARDRIARRARRDDAETRGPRRLSRGDEQHEMARAHGSPGLLDAYEIRAPTNAAVAAEAQNAYFL